MKKNLLTILLFQLIVIATFAQKNVQLNIEHLLGEESFSTSIESSNDLTNTFTTSRVEYYVSQIAIVHDGGTITNCDGVYLLVNAQDGGKYILGEYDVNSIEAIQFYIGVNTPENNEDPAQWPSTHALSPKMPSMHWGWSAGYRFVCMEGNTTSSQNQQYQIHALGNQNYFGMQIPVEAVDEDGTLIINLKADYTKALSQINVSFGLIVHGDINESVTLLKNFSEKVFTSSTGEASISLGQYEYTLNSDFKVFPNPNNGNFQISIPSSSQDYTLKITDLSGREISTRTFKSQHELKLETGIYLLQVLNENEPVALKRVVVQ